MAFHYGDVSALYHLQFLHGSVALELVIVWPVEVSVPFLSPSMPVLTDTRYFIAIERSACGVGPGYSQLYSYFYCQLSPSPVNLVWNSSESHPYRLSYLITSFIHITEYPMTYFKLSSGPRLIAVVSALLLNGVQMEQ